MDWRDEERDEDGVSRVSATGAAWREFVSFGSGEEAEVGAADAGSPEEAGGRTSEGLGEELEGGARAGERCEDRPPASEPFRIGDRFFFIREV